MTTRQHALLIVLTLALGGMFFIAGTALAEGVLKVYTHADVSEMGKWASAAEKAVGARIDWSPRLSSNELWRRVEAEAPNFQADVIWGFMNSQAMIGAAKDWFVAYDLDSVAILKGCKNLEAARKLLDWLGTKEAMELVGQTRSRVTRAGVRGTVSMNPKLIKYNAMWAGENQNRVMNTWKDKFQQ